MGTSSCILPGVSKEPQIPSHVSPSHGSFREESTSWISHCGGIMMAAGSFSQEPEAVKLLGRTHHITLLNQHQGNRHCSGHGSADRRRRRPGWTVKGISGMSPRESPAQLWLPFLGNASSISPTASLMAALASMQRTCSGRHTALGRHLYSPFAAVTGHVGAEEKRDLV